LVNRLVFENLKHRPVRTLLSAVMIGVQVTMILTLVGLSSGVLGDIAQRSRGTGADIMILPPGSSVLAFSGNMSEGTLKPVRAVPHVAIATGVFHQSVGNFEAIDGINLQEFDQMSGGFRYLAGGPFTKGGELMIDDFYAQQKHLKVGNTVNLGLPWRVVAVVEPGKLSRMFADLGYVQDHYSALGKVTTIYVKLDNSANTDEVKDALETLLPTYNIYSIQRYMALVSVDSIPLLKTFTKVVIGLGVLVGFLVVFLSMYTAVLERTREIGILKALGASPGYILGMLLRETTLLAIVGAIAGIAMSFGTQWLMRVFVPTMPVEIVQAWWPRAAGLALGAALIGAIYPGLKAARQDAIEALSYD
jgi:putative ABC transport system permease protein